MAIRLRFNDVLSQFDLFTEVITQRSEHGTGVWLSGLDVLAADALRLDARPRSPVLRPAAAGLLPGARPGRGDPPGPDPAARRAVEPGRHHPGAAGADGRPRHRLLAGARGRPPGRGAAGSRPVDAARRWPRRTARVGRRAVAQLGPHGLRVRRGLLVGRQAGDRLDPRPDGRGEPAPVLRVPAPRHRPAPHAVPAGSAQRSDGRRALPAPAVDRGRRHLAGALSPRQPAGEAAGSRRGGRGHHPRDGGQDGRSPTAGAARPVRGQVLPLAERRPERLLGLLPRLGPATWAALARQPPTLVFAAVGQARAAGRINPVAGKPAAQRRAERLGRAQQPRRPRTAAARCPPPPRKDLDRWPPFERKTTSVTTT